MAQLDFAIEASDLPQTTSLYDPIPEGNYGATITQAELRPTNDGSGQYIKLRLDVTGPSHQGRVIFSNINIRNASPKAEEIGRQQLGDIMRALGLAKVSDTDQLIGGNVNIKVAIRPARTDERTGRTYDASNEVKGYRSINGSAAPAAKPAPSAPAAQTNGKAAPPWSKK